jgi:hypothetical protein
MHPFSYTGLKIVHDQKIQEAMKQQCLYARQETQWQGLLQMFSKFLARFNNHLGEPSRTMLTHKGHNIFCLHFPRSAKAICAEEEKSKLLQEIIEENG